MVPQAPFTSILPRTYDLLLVRGINGGVKLVQIVHYFMLSFKIGFDIQKPPHKTKK